jgi:arabinose-5-phosphate isomerase
MPVVKAGTLIKDAVMEIDNKGIGATVVVDNGHRLLGILTDGDLRRALIRHKDIHSMKVEDVMTVAPKSIDEESSAAEALGVMELYGITHLIVLDRDSMLKGVLHLHDLLGREDFKLNGGHTST